MISRTDTIMHSEEKHLIQLRQAHYRRLCVLELKAAQQGTETPADILIEIEDLREKITDIDIKINKIQQTIHKNPTFIAHMPNSAVDNVTQQIEIVFKGDFSDLTPELQSATIRAIAALANISPEQVKVIKVMSGSIVYKIEIPMEAAELLKRLDEANDPLLRDAGVVHIRSVPEEVPVVSVTKPRTYSSPSSSRKHPQTGTHIPAYAREKTPVILVEDNNLGAVEAQVTLLTNRINQMIAHLRVHMHNHHLRRGLLKMVGRRRRLLAYLHRIDHARYERLIKRLGLRR